MMPILAGRRQQDRAGEFALLWKAAKKLSQGCLRFAALWGNNPAAPPTRRDCLGCGCSSGVEHNLAKVGVEGSNPFARSRQSQGLRSMQASDLPALFAFWAWMAWRHFRRDSEARGYLAVTGAAWRLFAGAHCLKQFSRCHCRKCGCGRSWVRSGGSARPVRLMKLRIPSASLACREMRMSRSSDRLIKPRSNIQCAMRNMRLSAAPISA